MLTRGEYYCIVPGGYMLDKELKLVEGSERFNLRLWILVVFHGRDLRNPIADTGGETLVQKKSFNRYLLSDYPHPR
jgi:hypothetical protein